MHTQLKLLLLLLGCCLTANSMALSMKQPDFPAPPRASVEVVSNNMQINGIATQVRVFKSREETGEIVNFYKELWDEGEEKHLPGYTITNTMEPWLLITRIEKGYLMTVQLQEQKAAGSWGYLAVSKLPRKGEKPEPIGKKIPTMHDSRVMNEIKSRDIGQNGRSVVVMSPHSVTSNINFYRSHYQTAGWSTNMDRTVEDGKMHAFSFKRGRERVNIMIMGNHKESRIVVNEVQHDIL